MYATTRTRVVRSWLPSAPQEAGRTILYSTTSLGLFSFLPYCVIGFEIDATGSWNQVCGSLIESKVQSDVRKFFAVGR